MSRCLAIFGGTFDPIHKGHIQTSLCIQTHFNFHAYYLLPCKIPTIKPPSLASTQQRIDMLGLTIKNHPEFQLDLREINRHSASHMAETLKSFRKENKKACITLILGYDSFLSLPQWAQWRKLIRFANLLVINRQSFSEQAIAENIKKLLARHQTECKTDLLNKRAGKIYFFDAGHYDISSSLIREKLKQNKPIKNALETEVYEYIQSERLYRS
jgi:nicotinate-nucleotide adenylyltransferase